MLELGYVFLARIPFFLAALRFELRATRQAFLLLEPLHKLEFLYVAISPQGTIARGT
jgi:hypothetical protein